MLHIETDRLEAFRKQIIRGISMRKINAPIVDNTGARPVIVVGEHERLSSVLLQAARSDGFANLFMVEDAGGYVSASMLPEDSALSPGERLDAPIHMDIEIGMLLAAARPYRDGLTVPVELPRQSGLVRDPMQHELAA